MANHSVGAALSYRRNLLPSPTVDGLVLRFGRDDPHSVRASLRHAGPFRAIAGKPDAFAFSNSDGWQMTARDAAVLRDRAQAFVDAVTVLGVEAIRGALLALSVPVPAIGAVTLPMVAVDAVMVVATRELTGRLLESIVVEGASSYGRCGGMAFAALDYFLAGRDVSNESLPVDGPLHDFIWQRLLDSLELNALRFLEWTMQLHVLPAVSVVASAALGAAVGSIGGPIGAAFAGYIAGKSDVLHLGGAKVLAERTASELDILGQHLSEEAGWPIGVIFDHAPMVWDQHQVLALSQTKRDDGQFVLRVWDNNFVRQEHVWVLDTRGDALSISGAVGSLQPHIKGIICEEYRPAVLPAR